MFDDFIAAISRERGRYPVANMVGDYLKDRKGSAFGLGTWLAGLDQESLEDVQLKLDTFLQAKGPDHAAEDLIVAVDLMSSAEAGSMVELTDKQIHARMFVWHEANLLEKLSRIGMVVINEPLRLSAENRPTVTFDETFSQTLFASIPREVSLPTTLTEGGA